MYLKYYFKKTSPKNVQFSKYEKETRKQFLQSGEGNRNAANKWAS